MIQYIHFYYIHINHIKYDNQSLCDGDIMDLLKTGAKTYTKVAFTEPGIEFWQLPFGIGDPHQLGNSPYHLLHLLLCLGLQGELYVSLKYKNILTIIIIMNTFIFAIKKWIQGNLDLPKPAKAFSIKGRLDSFKPARQGGSKAKAIFKFLYWQT